MNKKTALIAGATGLVGNEVLHLLLESSYYKKVYALARRPLGIDHPKLIEVICDFEKLEEVENYFAVDDVFCALGTTIKKAKTKEAMYRIDVDYTVNLAVKAKEKGAKHYLIVSSMNANKNSLLFYPKIKGELEEKLKAIPFEALSIFQPSLLLGDRKEFRLLENIGIKVVRTLTRISGNKSGSRLGIEAKTVAAAMVKVADSEQKGIHTYSTAQMVDMVR
ncbi:oxidoreductase [Alkalihalobacterium elongatum]|uniref:oxidoreductase n=1 Tax=Alkalihalobacterium elongatum TaxID=2675466 RepID=UPI001C1F90AF|nr:oxidoreductase [Alkalihalobacterium elongatum]